MFTVKSLVARSALIGAAISLVSSQTVAQEATIPDLEGIWTNASLTGLTRPRDVEKLIVTADEAQVIAANTSIAGLPVGEFEAPEASTPRGGACRRINRLWTPCL